MRVYERTFPMAKKPRPCPVSVAEFVLRPLVQPHDAISSNASDAGRALRQPLSYWRSDPFALIFCTRQLRDLQINLKCIENPHVLLLRSPLHCSTTLFQRWNARKGPPVAVSAPDRHPITSTRLSFGAFSAGCRPRGFLDGPPRDFSMLATCLGISKDTEKAIGRGLAWC